MNDYFRSREWMDLCYLVGCYLQLPGICEGGDSAEPAHSNQPKHGKGGSIKAHDCFVVPACRACHREFDQGRTMSRDEKRERWDAAFLEWLPVAMKLDQDGHTIRRRRA